MSAACLPLVLAGSPLRDPLLGYLEEPMETGEGEAPATYRPRSSKLVSGSILPELDIYLHLLVLLQQIDSRKLDKVTAYCPVFFFIEWLSVTNSPLFFRQDVLALGWGVALAFIALTFRVFCSFHVL